MSMIEQFQKLDNLIVENTQPPVRTMLRNQLALTREQVEAYQAASDKQDETLAKQAETIAALQHQCQEHESQHRNSHRFGVTFRNGKTVFYPGNTYALLPNKNAPVTIEFRMLDKVKHTYREVGHAQWADVSEVHEPLSGVEADAPLGT